MEIRDYNYPVAEITAKIIRERGLKNKAVAEKAGYSEQMLSDMLNGRKLIRIVDAIKSTTWPAESQWFFFLMDQVSAGTQHFFARIGGWLQALQNGAFLFVDEIEDSLHPLLTRRLIGMVQDQAVNIRGAQLLFTTHDAIPFIGGDGAWQR